MAPIAERGGSPFPRKNPAKDNMSNNMPQCGIVISAALTKHKGVH